MMKKNKELAIFKTIPLNFKKFIKDYRLWTYIKPSNIQHRIWWTTIDGWFEKEDELVKIVWENIRDKYIESEYLFLEKKIKSLFFGSKKEVEEFINHKIKLDKLNRYNWEFLQDFAIMYDIKNEREAKVIVSSSWFLQNQ